MAVNNDDYILHIIILDSVIHEIVVSHFRDSDKIAKNLFINQGFEAVL